MLRWYLIKTTIYPLGIVVEITIDSLYCLCILYHWGDYMAFSPLYSHRLAVVHSHSWDRRRSQPPKGEILGGSPCWVLLSAAFLLVAFPHKKTILRRETFSARGISDGCLL